MSSRCWILGGTAWDRVARVAQLPVGELAHASSYVEQLGGSGANMAVGLARAGVDPGLVTYVGEDDDGDRLLRALREHGVSDAFVARMPVPTQSALVIVDDAGARTIVVLHQDACRAMPIPIAQLRSGDIVFLAHPALHALPALPALQRAGVRIVSAPADDGSAPPAADVVLGSQFQLRSGAVRRLLDAGTPVVVRTLGAGGAEVWTPSAHESVPARPATPINTTGAGDAFAAGLLLAMSRGAPLRTAVEAGVLWGARAVEVDTSVAPSPPPAVLALLRGAGG